MTRIKICGITNFEDANIAVESGADALGFIFYNKSKRFVDKHKVRDIINSLPPFVSTVGVFVNHDHKTICDIINATGIRVVQCHGEESPGFCKELSFPVIKVIRVKDEESIKAMKGYNAQAFLLDTYSEKMYGGVGRAFDWDIAVKAKESGRVILAGGLNPQNVCEAVTKVKPYCVDVSSGVEANPGKKDWKKINSFINEVRRADGSSG